ncbi:MAG: hypothetical protein A2X31_13110 [Elusimicrobia bacterium GWB2_63_22]|nr:MAG: hypothetical protein A2X31_13110 [Elusimicrobia bacterium GWB2_63_22]
MNQKTIKGLGLAAVALFLVGCNEINFSGLLNVTEPITFAGQDRVNVVVNPGQFNTKASIGKSGSKKVIKLEIANGAQPTKVELSFDKNINIGAAFTLTAAQIGQNFDMNGTMDTKVEKSPEYSRSEFCTYQMPQTVCRSAAKSAAQTASEEAVTGEAAKLDSSVVAQGSVPEASNPALVDTKGPQFNGPVPYAPTCHTQWITMNGYKYVRYYVETTTRDIKSDFVQAGRTLGSYSGLSVEHRDVYTYEGQCR